MASQRRPSSDITSLEGDLNDGASSMDLDRAPARPAANKRFSLMRFRHFSDTQLFTKAKMHADAPPHAHNDEPSPTIITTAPTTRDDVEPRTARPNFFTLRRRPSQLSVAPRSQSVVNDGRSNSRNSFLPWRKSPLLPPQDTSRLSSIVPASALERKSMSDMHRAQISPVDQRSPSDKNAKKRFLSTRSMKRKSLFPLPNRIVTPPATAPVTPRESSVIAQPTSHPSLELDTSRPSVDTQQSRSAIHFAPPAFPLVRNASASSTTTTKSPPPVSAPGRLGPRDRASTMSTFRRASEDMTPPPTIYGSARNSVSTSGRASLGGLLTLNRFRHGSETNGSRHDSPSSKSNSFAISRDLQALPAREGTESAATYLDRLRATVPRSVIAAMLSQSGDPFYQTVLRSYTRKIAFFGEPIDMSLRKFLLEAELPRETVHVDRVIQAFADRYHECNPGIFLSPDQAYVIAFSLMMLHTDAFNKNNKHKMQKDDYIKNSRGQHVAEDVLACFYENICYTPFIHFDEDDYEQGTDKLVSRKSNKLKTKNPSLDPAKKASGPVDPYSLIIDSKLDCLRPSIKESINLEDPYTYLGTLKAFDTLKIQSCIVNTGILEVISARSRPTAFETQATRDNPEESRPGVVQIQVIKVGLLWRKNAKRKKGRSPWQEWGAILTGSQLYFFKNSNWVRSLMYQYQTHQKSSGLGSPVVFKPSLPDFKPDALTKTDDAVALLDRSYNKHKNAFQLLRTGGEEEVFLADNEPELNEWISLINYTAAFRYAGVSIRAFDDNRIIRKQQVRMTRMNSTGTTATTKSGQVPQSIPAIDTEEVDMPKLNHALAARRRVMIVRIAEAEIALKEMHASLDAILRNARHLQVLAPIQSRTRETVIHSAAKMDAMLKWSRREIWKTRCYKEVLMADALDDSDDVIDESLKQGGLVEDDQEEGNVADQVAIGVTASNRPPQTPQLSFTPLNLSTPELGFMDDEVFRTPPETSRHSQSGLQAVPSLEDGSVTSSSQRSASIMSTVASTSTTRRPSLTPLSNTSGQDLDQVLHATVPVADGPRTPNAAGRTADTVQSQPATIATRIAENAVATPESSANKSRHRMSLHRSFRESQHEGSGSQRHRKARDSASTIRSELNGGGGASAEIGNKNDENTTGLERGKGSFIVHGKQASVITFGEDWNDERIRAQREGDRRRLADVAAEPVGPVASAEHAEPVQPAAGVDGVEMEHNLEQGPKTATSPMVHAKEDEAGMMADGGRGLAITNDATQDQQGSTLHYAAT